MRGWVCWLVTQRRLASGYPRWRRVHFLPQLQANPGGATKCKGCLRHGHSGCVLHGAGRRQVDCRLQRESNGIHHAT